MTAEVQFDLMYRMRVCIKPRNCLRINLLHIVKCFFKRKTPNITMMFHETPDLTMGQFETSKTTIKHSFKVSNKRRIVPSFQFYSSNGFLATSFTSFWPSVLFTSHWL